jgi:hypothetical protein
MRSLIVQNQSILVLCRMFHLSFAIYMQLKLASYIFAAAWGVLTDSEIFDPIVSKVGEEASAPASMSWRSAAPVEDGSSP